MHLKAQLQHQYSYKTLALIFRLDNYFFTLSLSEGMAHMETLYGRVMELISEDSSEGIDIILQEVSQYIERNDLDSNLNLNTIAAHFAITPSYLSRKYRDHYGYTINDYLYQIRMHPGPVQRQPPCPGLSPFPPHWIIPFKRAILIITGDSFPR